MCVSKFNGAWRRRASRAALVLAISAATLVGSAPGSGASATELSPAAASERVDPQVARAQSAARDAELFGAGAGPSDALLPMSAAEALARVIY